MASTTFVDNATPVVAAWLNDVNTATYKKLTGYATVKDYGAVGDGTTDDSAAITAALAANDAVKINTGFNCKIGSTISLGSNKTLFADGNAKLTLAAGVNNHVIQIASGASHVTIRNIEINGTKASNTGGCGIACTGTGATYVTIEDCYIHDASADGVRFVGSAPCRYILCQGNIFESNTSAGLTSDNTIEDFTWINNVALNNGTHNIGLIGIGKYGTISGNTAKGAGTADNFTGYNASCDHLTITGNISRGGSNNGIHFGGSNLIISSNDVHAPAQHGIVVRIDGVVASVNSTVVGNNVRSAGNSGIWLDKGTEFAITGNVVTGSTNHGILLDGNCINGVVSGNLTKSNGADGIRTDTSASQINISGNTCIGNTSDGIQINNTTETIVSGNTCKDNATPFIESGTSNTNVIIGNDFLGNTSNTPTLTGAVTEFRQNACGGTAIVASATALTLPKYTDYILCSGTTNVTSVTASWNRRVVIIRFDNVLTFTDGSNLKLAGNFVTTADDTITLVCDGTDWYEIARSIN